MKSLIRHLGLANGIVQHVWWFSWTLPDNCDVSMWKMISDSLAIDFIHGIIHCRSCKNIYLYAITSIWSTSTNHVVQKVVWGVLIRCPTPVPQTIFRSNSKFDQNLSWSGLECTLLITTKFCTCHDSATVMTCAKFLCDQGPFSISVSERA